jgi:hypothetical protein
LAAAFNVTPRHVRRVLSGEQRVLLGDGGESPVLEAMQRLVDDLLLDRRGEVVARTALAIAGKIDKASVSESVGAANALPGLTKALADVLDELEEAPGAPSPLDEIRARLAERRAQFATDGG